MAGRPKRRARMAQTAREKPHKWRGVKRNPGLADYFATATSRVASATAQKAKELADKAQKAAEKAQREAEAIEEKRLARVTPEAALRKLAAEYGFILVKSKD